jgi:AbrB family looped-hinge helix DNA binding protein
MSKSEEKKESCCTTSADECCKVESLVTIDERGQMILPKDLREKAGLAAGDKLVIATSMKNGRVWCLTLFKADDFGDMVKGFVGPVMRAAWTDKKEKK